MRTANGVSAIGPVIGGSSFAENSSTTAGDGFLYTDGNH
jgi:hypothetical protein